MKIKYVFSLVIASVLGIGFSGCSVKAPLVKYDLDRKPSYETIRNPSLNTISTVEIGTNIYSKSYLFTDNTYQVTLLESAFGKSQYAMINYDVTSNPTLTSKLLTWNKPYINTMCGIGSVWQVCLTDEGNTGSFTHVGNYIYGAFSKLDKPAKYEIKPSPPIPRNDSFKYEALYQGKIGNKIKISFREFKNDMARPAFTQDIDYELEKDNNTIIGFKGLRVEVIKATNMDITYKVTKDYN